MMLLSLQKEMFAAKVDGASGNGSGPPVIGGSYNSGPNPAANREQPGAGLEPPGGMRERKLSSGSGGQNQVGMKSKWVKAFKSIKGGKEEPDRYFLKSNWIFILSFPTTNSLKMVLKWPTKVSWIGSRCDEVTRQTQ